jgi:hypothetical protein
MYLSLERERYSRASYLGDVRAKTHVLYDVVFSCSKEIKIEK